MMDSTYNNEMSWASWMTPVDDEPTRESWLLSAIDRMARSLFPAFKQPKWTCPDLMDTPRSAKVSAQGVNGGEGRKTEAAEVFS